MAAKDEITLREPVGEDGSAVWELVKECKPLDENSMYCNLIQCDHFAETCVLAEIDGEAVGWISAYIRPDDPDTLFVWQVAVDSRMRGQGLALKMLLALIERVRADGVSRLETTISPGNEASEALFKKAFRLLGAEYSTEVLFSRDTHFNGQHDDEVIYRAGPFTQSAPQPAQA